MLEIRHKSEWNPNCAPLSIYSWLDKTNEVKSGEGEKLIQRFFSFLFHWGINCFFRIPKSYEVKNSILRIFLHQYILDRKSLMRRGKQVVALLSGPAAAFKEQRITARCRFSLYLPSPDAIEVSASASLVRSGTGNLSCPEPIGSTQNAIMHEHGVD